MHENYFRWRVIGTLLFAGTINICQSQGLQELSKKIPPHALLKDYSVLRDTLEKEHPGIYRYKPKTEMDRIFDSCMNTLRDSMSLGRFYSLVSFTMASMEDGHTECRLSNESMTDFRNNARVFPAMVLFIDSRAYIFCCKQDPRLNGTEIVSINHRPMRQIIQKHCCPAKK